MSITIVADDKIPFLKGVFEPFANVKYLPGKNITPADLSDADALIVRTRTKCNKALLQNTPVRFVATATIGFDHINPADLEALNIQWTNAPGCNADSVKNYISSALAAMDRDLSGKTLGIIGVGHVGSRVAIVGKAFGMNVLLNDPPRAEKEGSDKFVTLDELLEKSDIVTLHVPLSKDGKYPTLQMADEKFFSKMRNGACFFNSCRGETIDPEAFLKAEKSGKISKALMDVWPGEPDIAPELLNAVDFSTPHIAGYSADGKANGTTAAVRYIAEKLGINALLDWTPEKLPEPVYNSDIILDKAMTRQQALNTAVLHAYDIRKDAEALRNAQDKFEFLRGSYWIRREFSAYTVHNAPETAVEALQMLGFKTL